MKRNKLISFILAVLMLCSVGIMSACNTQAADAAYNTSATGTVTETALHKVTGTVHRRGFSAGTNVLVEDGVAKYTILHANNEYMKEYAAHLKVTIQKNMGVIFTVKSVAEEAWNSTGYYIVIGDNASFNAAGGTMPSEDLGERGYTIKTIGRSVFLMSKMVMGARNAVVDFMNFAFGYEYYATGICDWDYAFDQTVYMPNFTDVVEIPDFALSMNGNAYSTESAIGWRMNKESDVFVPLGGLLWHNVTHAIDPEVYLSSHPSWFSTENTYSPINNGTVQSQSQLCMTTRGDSAEYNALVNLVTEMMIEEFDKKPTVNHVTFTISDWSQYCECKWCKDSRARYGGAESAAAIKFCNAVSAKLDAHYGSSRTVKVLFFAYFYDEQPPSGSYVSEVRCSKNVGVYIAPIYAQYNKSFYHSNNVNFKGIIEDWAYFTDNLFFWLYETNYSHYLFPLDTYDTMIETLRFCKSQNGYFMFIEGQYNTGNVTAFGKLKEYTNAKACWDVNVSFSDILDDYFPAMFREGGDIMRKFFEELQIRCKQNYAKYPALAGGIYETINKEDYWQHAQLKTWLGYCDKAMELIAHYEKENPELYEALKRNITTETIFPRYAILQFYRGYYTDSELKELRSNFVTDCQNLGITNSSESVLLDNEFAGWET